MKSVKRECVALCSVMILLLGGCARTANVPDIQVIKDEVVAQETIQEVILSSEEMVPLAESVALPETASDEELTSQGESAEEPFGEENIDCDLTQMGSDMVFATVYQMMIDPASYEGKKVKMSGKYYSVWYEPTAKYYFYVLIEDAMACCSQGMEFVWEDGSHVYPDEYPADGSEVEVKGIFETYTEEGDQALYCRLKDATLTIVE